jgi:Ni/Co efflux regulator RcnB
MKRLILSAAAVAVLAGPALAQSDQGQDHRNNNAAHPQRQSGAPANRTYTPPAGRGQGSAPTYHAPQGGAVSGPRNFTPQNRTAPTYRAPTTTGQYGGYRGYQGGQSTPTRPNTGQYQGTRQYQGGQYQGGQYQGGQYQGGQYQGGQYQGTRQYQGSRQYQGGQYRGGQYQTGRTWNRNSRLSGDWWRGRRGFEGYAGHRSGFWFAPGWGYYQVDPRWYGYDWEVGAVVPYELRSYYVSDPEDYGLPPAPYGAAWVFLGDQIVLIDLQSGDIIQIAGSY